MRALGETSPWRAVVAQCWTSQLLLLLGMLVLSLLQSAIKDDFGVFLIDPGEPGWRAFCVLVAAYAVMPVATRIFASPWFRWLNAGLLTLTLLVPVGHQLKHFLEGKPPDISLAPELAMVAVALVGGWAAVRWARSAGPGHRPSAW